MKSHPSPPYPPSALQCLELVSGSGLLTWLSQDHNPQSAMGTDWTLIGSEADATVASDSATMLDSDQPGHKAIYLASAGITHGGELGYLAKLTSPSFSVKAWHYYDPTWRTTTTTLSPIRWTRKALYENHNW
jgi:hypothetical protein